MEKSTELLTEIKSKCKQAKEKWINEKLSEIENEQHTYSNYISSIKNGEKDK